MDDQLSNAISANNPELQPKPADVTAGPHLPPPVKNERSSQSWERLRQFFACNPFYLISAALLLYSFYLVSSDRSFLPAEAGQLSFNLSSLQFYEILVVTTAIFLARRAIWYDSTLLAGLENLLLLVPFILISQAALIDSRLVWLLCVAAALLAGGRVGFLRRFIPQLNFPRRLAWLGTFVLVMNAALPIVYRVLHESKFGTKPDWGAAYETNQYTWWVLLPLLCALICLVPSSRAGVGHLWPQRRWLPMGLFSLWLVGTGVHLYCLGYVYDFSLRPELPAPAIWTLAWVLYLKLDQVLPSLKQSRKDALWVLPVLATLFATPQPEKAVFLALTVLNASIFVSIYLRRRVPLALHLALISMAAVVGGLPAEWARALTPQFDRETCVAGAAVIYLLICTALSRDPKLGILGALAAAISVGIAAQHSDAVHWAVQIGLVFLLIHSLRWVDSEVQGASALRWLAALAWIAHSVVWTHVYNAGWRVGLIAVAVLAAWFIFRCIRGKWGSLAILLASSAVMLSAPSHAAVVQLQSTPAGLLAVIASFVLFGLGTLGAVTKHRWSAP